MKKSSDTNAQLAPADRLVMQCEWSNDRHVTGTKSCKLLFYLFLFNILFIIIQYSTCRDASSVLEVSLPIWLDKP